jgi:glyoxylase-like metal-dependent hydrolase (beta-lactamase superfamily II)
LNDVHSAPLDYPLAHPPAPGEAIEIAPNVLWLRMPLPFALDHINLWLVRGPDGFVAIDSGYGDAATRAMWERHFATTLSGRPIVAVVVTHYHPDHIGNAAWLAERFDCPVTMTLSEYLTALAVRTASAGHSPQDTGRLFHAHGMAADDLDALARRGNAYAKGVPELPNAIRRVLDGETVATGALRWRVIEGFGHSPEHAALFLAKPAVLVSGDMLLPRISTNVAVWGSAPDADPLARFLASIRAFTTLPPDTLVLPSHGLPFRGIATRVDQLALHHALRLSEVVEAVGARGGHVCAADIVPMLFRRELDLQQRFFAMGEAIAHLNHLWHDGTLTRRVAADRSVRFARADNADGLHSRPDRSAP